MPQSRRRKRMPQPTAAPHSRRTGCLLLALYTGTLLLVIACVLLVAFG